jgi:hypothetical protein
MGLKEKGSAYDDVALRAAHGRYGRSHGHAEILKLLLAKGELTNLRKLRREIIGKSCYWGREDVLRLVLKDFPRVRFQWRGAQTPIDVAIARKRNVSGQATSAGKLHPQATSAIDDFGY